MVTTSIPRLRLFDYNGASRPVPPVNPDASYRVQPTTFNPAYSINDGNTNIDVERLLGQNLVLADGFGQLNTRVLPSQAAALGFAQKTTAPQTTLTTGSVTQPYQQYLDSLTVSERNYQTLVQQGPFTIYNGDVGLRVQTDGTQVTGVSIEPGTREQQTGTPANANLFPDRSVMTERAASLNANDVGPVSPFDPNTMASFKPAGLPRGENQTLLPENLGLFTAAIQGKPEKTIGTLPRLTSADIDVNPLARALYRLQPPEVDVAVFGPESNLPAVDAKKIAASQSGYQVDYSPELSESLRMMREHAAAIQNSRLAERIVKAREGNMPIAPFYPTESNGVGYTGFSGGGTGMDQMGSGADSADKKSKGGGVFVPFRSGSGAGGNDGQEQPRHHRRQPLSAIA